MATRKKYECRSILTMQYRIGGKRNTLEFIPSSKGSSYYMTAKKEEQDVIEGSYYFKKGMVRMVSSENIATPKGVEEKNAKVDKAENGENTATSAGVRVYDGVTRLADAVNILRNEYAVTSPLSTKGKVLEASNLVGVSFPNL